MLLIDVQGQLAQIMHEKDKLLKSLEIMVKGDADTSGVPIIWVEQIPKNLGPTTRCDFTQLGRSEPRLLNHRFHAVKNLNFWRLSKRQAELRCC